MKKREFERTVDCTMLSGRLKGIDMFLQKTATNKYMFIYIPTSSILCTALLP